jgi:hypothetical protein
MTALLQVFADARGYREEATRARKLAEKACGRLNSELLEIATLYDHLADGKDDSGMKTAWAYPGAGSSTEHSDRAKWQG